MEAAVWIIGLAIVLILRGILVSQFPAASGAITIVLYMLLYVFSSGIINMLRAKNPKSKPASKVSDPFKILKGLNKENTNSNHMPFGNSSRESGFDIFSKDRNKGSGIDFPSAKKRTGRHDDFGLGSNVGTSKKMKDSYCASCGSALSDDDKFCQFCGAKV
ncbi:MAG: zinc ribbon domain-containing protein [Ruminococcaceae bacterium]|nr:zinc ribbon domain-containing protein [Oscillospiraceae bacterium]